MSAESLLDLTTTLRIKWTESNRYGYEGQDVCTLYDTYNNRVGSATGGNYDLEASALLEYLQETFDLFTDESFPTWEELKNRLKEMGYYLYKDEDEIQIYEIEEN
jgi:hypothetical protein